jgi:hypothetical protein
LRRESAIGLRAIRPNFLRRPRIESNGLRICRSTRPEAFEQVQYDRRGLAKRAKGDTAGGDADIAKAKQLDPRLGK